MPRLDLAEFVSKVEDLKAGRELPIQRSVDGFAFGKYKMFFPQEAVRHPAKIDINLLEYLILNYTAEGQVVLDPMAGTGSTAVISALLGRHGVALELEAKFYAWILEAKRRVEKIRSFGAKGKIIALHGDARELSSILEGISCVIDHIITSPPYADEFAYNRDLVSVADKAELWKTDVTRGYKGMIDVVLTSPPYEGTLGSDNIKGGITRRELEKELRHRSPDEVTTILRGLPVQYSPDRRNIGNLRGEAYTAAMSKVYAEMCAVLKPHAKAVIVVKPLIKRGQVVDLPKITWDLLEKAGFQLAEVLKFSLGDLQSFWRLLYYKKHREIPNLAHEYILVVEKPAK